MFLIVFAFIQQSLSAQCECTNCPLTLPLLGLAEGQLTIAGAASNTLNGTTQFVKAVKINVVHNALRECEITLIAPNGSSVMLSDNNGLAIANNITYDICFVDCTETPMPDPGFPAIFNPAAGYQSNQTYTGSYHPFNMNCLSTLTGPVNGNWTLRFQDFVVGDGGTLFEWSLEFVNNAGTGCTPECASNTPICGANGGNFVNLPQQNEFCINDPGLDLNLFPEFDPTPPDPNLYAYTYLLNNTGTNVTIEYDPDANFTDLPPGNYRVCGLSYLIDDEPNLPPINSTNLRRVIQNLINDEIICADFSDNCFEFSVVGPLLPPTISGPTTVCGGELVTYTFTNPNPNITPVIAVVSGSFSFFNVVGNQVNIIWNSGSQGVLCISVENACGILEDCIDVEVIPFISDFFLDGNLNVCQGDVESYILTPNLPPSYIINYTVTGGSIVSQTDNEVVIQWGAGPGGQICMEIITPCGLTINTCRNIVVGGPTNPPNMHLSLPSCVGTIVTAGVVQPGFYTSFFWTVSSGTIISGQGTNVINIQTTVAGILTICVEVTSLCGLPESACVDLLIFDGPIPDIEIVEKCGLTGMIRVVNPEPGANYQWTVVSGPGFITFSPANSSSPNFTASAPGIYTIQVQENVNGCIGENTIQIEILPEFVISDFNFDCTSASGYVVSFTITGGLAPYFVDNNQIVGNTFTSNNIPFGSSYSFLVTDSEDCSQLIFGVEMCPCVSEAGVGSNNLITVCEDDIAIGVPVSGTFLDGNDIGVYVLHSSPNGILGTIYATSSIPEFGFGPFLAYGVVYYISYIVGNEIGGTVDINDPCLSVSVGQPVIFYQNPQPFAGIDIQTCVSTIDLDGINGVVGSNVLWNILVGGNNINIHFPDQIFTPATVTTAGFYQLELLEDNQGCIGTDILDIHIFDPIVITNKTVNCDPASENYTVTFDISGGNPPYSVNGVTITGATFTSSPIPSGNTYSFEMTDNTDCLTHEQGIFNCNCNTEAGTMSSDVLVVCALGGIATAIYNNDGVLDPNDIGMYVLHTNISNILGTVLAFNTTGSFVYDPAYALDTRYYISYVIGNENGGLVDLSDPCLGVAPGQPVIFRSNPPANIDPVTERCELMSFVSAGASPNVQYFWSSAHSEITFDNSNARSTIVRSTMYGSYEIILTVTNDACSSESTITLVFNQPLGPAQIVSTCKDLTTYDATITISGVTPLTINVPSSMISDNVFLLENLPSDVNITIVITSANGCTSTFDLEYDCACQSTPGTMSAIPLSACENDFVRAVYNEDGSPGDVDSFIYILHTSPTNILGTILGTSADGRFVKLPVMDFNVTYYISYVTVNFVNGNYELSPCSFITFGQPVIFYENPTLTWNVTPALCEPMADFVITSNSSLSNLVVVQSPSNANVSDFTLTGLTSDLPGSYIVSILADNNGCQAVFTQEFELYDSPVINDIKTDCAGLEFTTTFEISGGTAPYFLNGNIPVTSPYKSDKIPSLVDFTFFIEDSRGCVTSSNTVTKECTCITDAGSLDSGNINLCEGEHLNPNFPDNYILDSGDGFTYFLHDGSPDSIGTIILETKIFPILYIPAYAGQQYIITRVVGNVLSGGNIDLTDDCTDVTEGIVVIWSQKPDIKVLLDVFYCEGSSIILNIENVNNGILDILINGNTNVSVIPGINAITLDNSNVKNGDILEYLFTDDFGCIYSIGSDIINIKNLPYAGVQSLAFESCINVETTINLSDYLSGEDQGGRWYLGGFAHEISSTILINNTFTNDTTMYYLVENECGEDTSFVHIIRRPAPIFQVESQDPKCFGINDGRVTIIPGEPEEENTYTVNGNVVLDLNLVDLPSGKYNIEVANRFGCITQDEITLEQANPITTDIGVDLLLEEGASAEVNAISNIPLENIVSTIWTLPNGEVISGRFLTIPIIGDIAGQLSLVITDINGCTAQDFLLIFIKEKEIIIELPNVLLMGSSANGFFTVAPNPGIVEVLDCSIYDRWGNKVYSVNNVSPGSFGWDGTFQNTECMNGVYVYTLSLLLTNGEKRLFFGDITVIK